MFHNIKQGIGFCMHNPHTLRDSTGESKRRKLWTFVNVGIFWRGTMWHSCHEGPNSPVQPVHWNWKVNWIHGQVWYEILHVHSEANASVLQMKLTTRDWIWCAMRASHLSWKNRTCMDKYGSSMDISLLLCHLKLRGFRTSMFGAFQIEVTNMPHPQRHLPQISHPTPSGYHECIIYTMFPPRHRETKGKCVVEAKGGFRGFGELRPVSMAGSSWDLD